MGSITLPIFPLCLELGAEVTYPYSPAVSTGLMLMAGQTLGVVYVALTTSLARPPSPAIVTQQQCVSPSLAAAGVGVHDWKCTYI
jgi:hypothetical protein